MPTLNWIGKDSIANHHRKVPFHVLRHKYGFTAEGEQSTETGSGNMIIHGDNLTALKSLLPRYEGRVDCIYIDPPYNTGNKTWVYNDNVDDPRLLRWLGTVVKGEEEDLSRHDKWMCMMYPRLELLRRLLSPKGAIFISIDDTEVSHLRLLMDCIFGTECFVGDIIWQRTYSQRNDSDGIGVEAEHIIAYSKKNNWRPNQLERTEEMDSYYKNPDNDSCGIWQNTSANAPNALTHQGMVYAIQNPFTGDMIYPPNGRCWALEQNSIFNIMQGWCEYEYRYLNDEERRAEICGITVDELKHFPAGIVLKEPLEVSREKAMAVYNRGQWPVFYFTKKGLGGIRKKTYLKAVEGRKATNLWELDEVGHTDEAKKELMEIFGGSSPFETPKPTRLIERILQIATDENSIILDSYAGSATTMHAAMRMNSRDRGNRRTILVELEDYAESITAERMRRVIGGYDFKGKKSEVLYEKKLTAASVKKMDRWLAEADLVAEARKDSFDKIGRTVDGNVYRVVGEKTYDGRMPGMGGAFDFYELGNVMIDEEGMLNESAGEAAIREYVFYSETQQSGEVMPGTSEAASGSGLSRYLLGRHNDTDYYFYYEPDRETVLNDDALNAIVCRRAAHYLIYADTCLINPQRLKEMNIVFKQIPRDIKKI